MWHALHRSREDARAFIRAAVTVFVCAALTVWCSAPTAAFATPACSVIDAGLQEVRPGDVVSLKIQTLGVQDTLRAWIGNTARPPFLPPGGHILGDDSEDVTYCYSRIVGNGRPGLYWLKFRAKVFRVSNGEVVLCRDVIVPVRLLPPLCDEPPTCEVSEAGPIQATVGGEFPEFTVCVEAGCDDAHGKLDLSDLPGFLGLVGQSRDAEGRCCYTFRVYACSTDVGLHTVTFKATNGDGGKPEAECAVDVSITGPDPEED